MNLETKLIRDIPVENIILVRLFIHNQIATSNNKYSLYYQSKCGNFLNLLDLNPLIDKNYNMCYNSQELLKYVTNPHLADTDHDGIADGYEVQNLSMLGIAVTLWSAILHTKDYDVDGFGGIFGYIDEFILGFFFASSLITFGETVWELLLEFLSILPRRVTDVQGVIY